MIGLSTGELRPKLSMGEVRPEVLGEGEALPGPVTGEAGEAGEASADTLRPLCVCGGGGELSSHVESQVGITPTLTLTSPCTIHRIPDGVGVGVLALARP